jgi:hypothetical protein
MWWKGVQEYVLNQTTTWWKDARKYLRGTAPAWAMLLVVGLLCVPLTSLVPWSSDTQQQGWVFLQALLLYALFPVLWFVSSDEWFRYLQEYHQQTA